MIGPELQEGARSVLEACRARKWRLATAESCTGGLIAAALTEIAGSSDVVERGFVTYSNEAKTSLLGVPNSLIMQDGAVSAAVAGAMAAGALDRSLADIAVAVTGVAGPGGGSIDKPVGTVWFGVATRGRPVETELALFPGDRSEVRRAAVLHAFMLFCRHCGDHAQRRGPSADEINAL